MKRKLILSYDIGTTSLKACAYDISNNLNLVASAMAAYKLNILDNGGAEQNPEDWYNAMLGTTGRLINSGAIDVDEVAGISFCSQMQGLVLVDESGCALRPAMSYMDGRAAGLKFKAG
ncbi:MAG TPA: carbohydrate kinase, partial [Spirochaeta sp.]|nr:carbohydrate kinase [Spirochaeta sp.]